MLKEITKIHVFILVLLFSFFSFNNFAGICYNTTNKNYIWLNIQYFKASYIRQIFVKQVDH